ncbi:MAG: hypothetical protein WKG00_21630 [Polyangiaceae bacterium]
MSQNPSSSPPSPAEASDAVVDAEVQRATAAYRELLPPDAFAEMQALVGDVLATHPVATVLVSRTRQRGPVERSGERPRDAVAPVGVVPGRARGEGAR